MERAKPRAKLRRAFTAARGRALARLRKSLDLQWTAPRSRDEIHERAPRNVAAERCDG
jgi:hypothetical protein